jgi:hypothetical protein
MWAMGPAKTRHQKVAPETRGQNVGGRWWHYHTNATDQVFNSLLKYTTERYGVFVQGSMKFGEPVTAVGRY